MKKYFGIALLVLFNAFFIALIFFGTVFSFGVYFIPLPEKEALEVANYNTWRLIIGVIGFIYLLLFLNFLIFKKMIATKRPKLWSALLSSISLIVFIPVLIHTRDAFMAFHKDMGHLKSDLKSLWHLLF